ncbi:uncharacterized protein VTP21DRAFT_1847 [Calcarisporiella thermophila]|uniref:uncharacterized protein n=1 Tax=Calcarisporiella thermophila TaxID=911321 RepID=UPI0037440693
MPDSKWPQAGVGGRGRGGTAMLNVVDIVQRHSHPQAECQSSRANSLRRNPPPLLSRRGEEGGNVTEALAMTGTGKRSQSDNSLAEALPSSATLLGHSRGANRGPLLLVVLLGTDTVLEARA